MHAYPWLPHHLSNLLQALGSDVEYLLRRAQTLGQQQQQQQQGGAAKGGAKGKAGKKSTAAPSVTVDQLVVAMKEVGAQHKLAAAAGMPNGMTGHGPAVTGSADSHAHHPSAHSHHAAPPPGVFSSWRDRQEQQTDLTLPNLMHKHIGPGCISTTKAQVSPCTDPPPTLTGCALGPVVAPSRPISSPILAHLSNAPFTWCMMMDPTHLTPIQLRAMCSCSSACWSDQEGP